MKHVVVVEDDALNAVLFRKLLERRVRCRVTVTESPEEVIRLVHEGGVSLVILDVSLVDSWWQGQQVSGIDICRMLKNDRATAGVPVMLATAHAMRGDAERLITESGADVYVSKPIVDHHQFVDQVRRWMGAEAA
ncbi:MAG TPA: response regulator [Candidatus Limnocylindria bacterium]|nr:response regulator [Candidatus Limnocylindria bacterium]